MQGFWRRSVGLFDVWSADFVFIHREAAPVGPPVFEWIIARIFHRRIIYDFDDAIWLTDKLESPLVKMIKCRGKVSTICKWSYRVSCGNAYLAEYAKKFNPNVVINPTTIDTDRQHNPSLVRGLRDHSVSKPLTIGWTGSHSTLKYLNELQPVFKCIESEHPDVCFLIIADKRPDLSLDRLTFIPWRAETEIADLSQIDIGVMPLPNDEWSKGKCGFKILQYMSLCIPSLNSPVGVNIDIVNHGINGFLCSTKEEWLHGIRLLIADKELRDRLGAAGRQTVVNHYSVNSNSATFLALFE